MLVENVCVPTVIRIFPNQQQVEMFDRIEALTARMRRLLWPYIVDLVKFAHTVDEQAIRKIVNHLKYSHKSFEVYPELVDGLVFESLNCLRGAKSWHDLAFVQTPSNEGFCLINKARNTLKFDRIGVLSNDGLTRPCKLVRFHRSIAKPNEWYATSNIKVSLECPDSRSIVIGYSGDFHVPLSIFFKDDLGLAQQYLSDRLAMYMSRIAVLERDQKNLIAALRKCDIPSSEYTTKKGRVESLNFELELQARAFAAEFAVECAELFATVSIVAPESPQMQQDYERCFIRLIEEELHNVFAQVQIKRAVSTPLFSRLTGLAYCPHCGDSNFTWIDGNEVRCRKHVTRKITVQHACSLNALTKIGLPNVNCKVVEQGRITRPDTF